MADERSRISRSSREKTDRSDEGKSCLTFKQMIFDISGHFNTLILRSFITL